VRRDGFVIVSICCSNWFTEHDHRPADSDILISKHFYHTFHFSDTYWNRSAKYWVVFLDFIEEVARCCMTRDWAKVACFSTLSYPYRRVYSLKLI
jgi:hypothetical protein